MKKILCATGIMEIDDAVSKFAGYEISMPIYIRDDIIPTCKDVKPDILILADTLKGRTELPEIIISLRVEAPNIRVIFLTGSIEGGNDRRSFFESLVYAGVYDIIHSDRITSAMILQAITNPKTRADVSYLTKKKIFESKTSKFAFEAEKEESEVKDYYDNLYSISSIKPGTGKSFLSVNIATTIAAYGKRKPDGKRPKVALVEADLQNLSLGTLLQIEDDKYNLKTAMDKVCSLLNQDGKIVGDMDQITETDAFIEQCFRPYIYCKNLHALVGSQLTFQQLKEINSYHYYYLIERIVNKFDVVIIDTNSALSHITTFPLLKMSKNCFYILNLDFNNVRNNVRYKAFLRDLGILEKAKYILNEDVPEDFTPPYLGLDVEDLEYTSKDINKEFDLIAKIPMLPKVIFLNKIYEGKPVALDTRPQTAKARLEIAKIAKQMWEIDGYEELQKEVEESKKKPSKSEKQGLFNRKKG